MLKQLTLWCALATGCLLAASPAQAAPSPAGGRQIDILGVHLCFGEVPAGTECDAHFSSNTEARPDPTRGQTMAMTLHLLDRKVCVGDLPDTQGCWIHVPHPDEATQVATGTVREVRERTDREPRGDQES